MAISKKVRGFMEKASWIRKMFEQGAKLKNQYGEKNVFDFSIGNPYLDPPEEFFEVLEQVSKDRTKGVHGYMSNAGYPETRNAIAEYLSEEHAMEIFGEHIIMTCGAGGGLNVIFKTILDPGDEVIVPAPYFVEYGFYVDNFGGILKTVPTKNDFSLDLAEIEKAISEKTKAVLINSPNNPTGRIYDKSTIDGLGLILKQKSSEYNKEIYLISDEPYSKIVYDNIPVPSILQSYTNSMIVTSYSKDLSIPGERLGFIAVNPSLEPLSEMLSGLIFSNRTLGFVNAPAIMQRVVKDIQGLSGDMDIYRQKRDLLCDMLFDLGYKFTKPEGAFYLFPKSPIDDIEFVNELQEEKILVVPGSGFGCPGYFRISYCVEDSVIKGAQKGFKKLAGKYL
jgi:aspartate aminotransferase